MKYVHPTLPYLTFAFEQSLHSSIERTTFHALLELVLQHPAKLLHVVLPVSFLLAPTE
jgi:hypothetical protein